MSDIPDEAVQAAADVWFMEYDDRQSGVYAMRAALAAALPHLTEDYEHHLRDRAMAREEAADAAERIAELEEENRDLHRRLIDAEDCSDCIPAMSWDEKHAHHCCGKSEANCVYLTADTATHRRAR